MSLEEGRRDSALAFPTFPLRTKPSFEVITERKLGHQELHDEWELFLEGICNIIVTCFETFIKYTGLVY